MAETRTDLVVNARAKGFQQVQQQAGKLVDQATKAAANQAKGYTKMAGSTSAYRKEVKELEKQLANLSKQQLATMKAMQGMDKVSNTYKQLKENLKNLGSEAVLTGKKIALTHQAFGPRGATGGPLTARQMGAGGFVQGLAQGGLGISLQRGPGMWRQAAGMAVGGTARAGIGAPFGGVEGLQRFIASLPGAGGFLGGQFSNAMQFAQGSLGLQQARLGAVPLFGMGGGAGGIEAARQRAMGSIGAPGGMASKQQMLVQSRQNATQAMQDFDLQHKLVGSRYRSTESYDRARQAAGDRAKRDTRQTFSNYQKSKELAGTQAAETERGRPFADVRQAGWELAGLSEQQAIESMSAVLQRGGGDIREARQQGMIRAGFAAQTAYGIGPEVQGAFLQAGRRGGAVGAEGRGAEAMVDTIADGFALGLKGSELQDYMAQMANDISAWKQTGMPINTKSIQQMGEAIAVTGLGGVRGAAIAGGIAKAGQRLSMSGIKTMTDLLVFQKLGGWQGGGIAEYEKAQMRLESMGGPGGWGEKDLKELFGAFTAKGKGGAGGREVLMRALSGMGVPIGGKTEAALLEKSMFAPETLTTQEREKANAVRQDIGLGKLAAPKGTKGLIGKSKEVMDVQGQAVRESALLQNKQNDIGGQMLKSMFALQESALNVNKSFIELAKRPIEAIASTTKDFTEAIRGMITSVEGASGALDAFAGKTPGKTG